jgi:hypothetical protein
MFLPRSTYRGEKEMNVTEANIKVGFVEKNITTTPKLIPELFFLLHQWQSAFKRKDVFHRAMEQAVASLLCLGRKTIASMAIYLKRSSTIPVADYKFYSERKWETDDLFRSILAEAVKYVPGDYITIGVDDTRLSKTGKKIPFANWGRDPMSPPFQTNLKWGLRELHFSIILPLYGSPPQIITSNGKQEKTLGPADQITPPRAIPVRWVNAPSAKRPGKKATAKQIEEYKEFTKTHNLSVLTVERLKELRLELDNLGLKNKTLIQVGDASFCNKTCMRAEIEGVIQVARCRKDAKLCFQAPADSRRFYDKRTFTPESVMKDDEIPWQIRIFFFGGEWREIKFKEVRNILWRNGTKRKLLRLIVIAPTPYWKGSKKNYRDPAFLLATDNEVSVEILIQAYIDRWQMEYCHRDAKSVLGVGEAQVRNAKSVVKQPAFHVAVYSAIMLAGVMAYGDLPHPDFGQRPKWRKPPRRLTLRALVGLLRGYLEEHPHCLQKYGIEVERVGVALRHVA